MHIKYDDWEKDAAQWQIELEESLTEHGGADLVTHYQAVALAFPSRTPLSYTFNYPRINESALRAWANERGWVVQTAREQSMSQDQKSPLIRFTKR